MVRAPCCERQGLKKGPWTPEEDKILVDYIQAHGHGIWRSLPKQAGLLRCGKSCRLRWINYLRPEIKRGPFTPEEQQSIVHLHGIVGNKWSAIAAQLPGRTDNEVKNYWNTRLKKRLVRAGSQTQAYVPSSPSSSRSDSGGQSSAAAAAFFSATRHMAQWESARLEAEARLAREPLLPPHSHAAAAPSAHAQAEPDVFLRIWHSEVGEAFRSRDGVPSTGASPASSSTKRGSSVPKQNERAVPSVSGSEAKEDGECKTSVSGGGGDAEETPNSKDTGEKAPEETYQTYLISLVGDDQALSSLCQESFGSFSWLGGDLCEETYLDTTAFK